VETVNQRGREFVALRLMTFIGQRFARAETPPGAVELGEELGVRRGSSLKLRKRLPVLASWPKPRVRSPAISGTPD